MTKRRKSCGCGAKTIPFCIFALVLCYAGWVISLQSAPQFGDIDVPNAIDGHLLHGEDFASSMPPQKPLPSASHPPVPVPPASSEQSSNSETAETDQQSEEDLTTLRGRADVNGAEPKLKQHSPQESAGNLRSGAPVLVVAMAAKLTQIDGPLVVISSALAHATDASRLRFRILTTAADAKPIVAQLKSRIAKRQDVASGQMQEVDIEAVDFDPWTPRVARLLGGKSSSRKELFDGLNFAAFYLHEVFPDVPGGRVLYLDTDVVVKSDLAVELMSADLGGQPAAVAEDCSQRMGKYVDLDRLKRKGIQREVTLELHASKKTCVVNRGVVLIDVARWSSANVTGAIEALVAAHLSSRGPLWRAGVSQPPFLISIAGRYHNLGAEYNVRGLGRGDIAPEEVDYYKKQKAWSSYYDKFLRKCEFNCCPGCKGWALSPFVAPLAQRAKILHFNGRLKPSARGRRSTAAVRPPPASMNQAEQSDREQRPLCSCGKECLRECSGIWWEYLPPQ
eukprot:TRINITY_DN11897_c0_g4_i1.p1 TRINITY_DN11897_c0_g4~~TRINITY_DN11897_c0_g4_i1.p1  ORF type:complete len:507 (+),score=85.03 TRINITY_DN11897_c0_g4_i1:116-1636(+)